MEQLPRAAPSSVLAPGDGQHVVSEGVPELELLVLACTNQGAVLVPWTNQGAVLLQWQWTNQRAVFYSLGLGLGLLVVTTLRLSLSSSRPAPVRHLQSWQICISIYKVYRASIQFVWPLCIMNIILSGCNVSSVHSSSIWMSTAQWQHKSTNETFEIASGPEKSVLQIRLYRCVDIRQYRCVDI